MSMPGNLRGLTELMRRETAARARVALTPAQVAARRMSLADFTRQAWPLVEPSTPLVWSWHLDAICAHVEALLTGRLGRQNLLVMVPPGAMKSTIVSVMAPAWMWINRPGWRSVFASCNQSVSTRDSLRCRVILESVWYRRTFGIQWNFADDQNQKTIYSNTATGFRQATTTGSRVTGSRPNALFVDDPLDAADAYSKAARDDVLTWWDQAFANRLADLRKGTRCVIMQRLHADDLAGHILSSEPQRWEVLCIPQLWEASRRTTTSLGWTDPRQEDGALMFPARFPLDAIDAERARLGISGFAGQHQQRPASAEGEIFRRDCLQLVDEVPRCRQVVISLDTAYSLKQSADYSVAVVLGEFSGGIAILDVVRARLAFPQLQGVAVELATRWQPAAVLVENKASGQSLIQALQQQTRLPIRAVDVDADKVARAHAVVPTWEAKRVFAPAGAPWLADLLEELYAFPKAAHDDQVDALVQGLRYLTQGAASYQAFMHLYAADRGEPHAALCASPRKTLEIDDRDPHHVVMRSFLGGAHP